MVQSQSIQSPVQFHTLSLDMRPSAVEDVPRPTSIQFDVEEPMSELKLLGVWRRVMRCTGLDCTAIALARNDPSHNKHAIFSRILSTLILILVFFRTGMLFNQAGPVLSFQWAESNLFAFMGIQSIVCSFCLFGWTKNAFFPRFLESLNGCRRLRMKPNTSLDDYGGLHKRAYIWGGLWVLAMLIHSVAAAFAGKLILGGKPAFVALYIIFPFLTLLSSIIVITCVITYFLINCSLSRELEYFNTELETAVKEKTLKSPVVLSEFCHRQAELIRLVRRANDSLGSYAGTAPMFCFYGFINGVYIASSFQDVLPTFAFAIMLFVLFAIIAMTVFTLRPASNVQFHLADASRILLDCEEFEQSPDLFKNYHILVDRSQKTDTRIRVVGGIPIYQTSMNVSMLLIPNLGNVLTLVRKVLVANGVNV